MASVLSSSQKRRWLQCESGMRNYPCTQRNQRQRDASSAVLIQKVTLSDSAGQFSKLTYIWNKYGRCGANCQARRCLSSFNIAQVREIVMDKRTGRRSGQQGFYLRPMMRLIMLITTAASEKLLSDLGPYLTSFRVVRLHTRL